MWISLLSKYGNIINIFYVVERVVFTSTIFNCIITNVTKQAPMAQWLCHGIMG